MRDSEYARLLMKSLASEVERLAQDMQGVKAELEIALFDKEELERRVKDLEDLVEELSRGCSRNGII